jgi:tetratricopeptide (TPR) repeat protein
VTLTPARIGGGTSHQEIVDIALLTLEEARGKSAATSKTGVTFAQEVPEPARKAYEKAVGLLEQGKTEEGVDGLKEALKLFTNYFLAWERLGIEYVKLQHYEAALFALNQAVKINQSAADSLYALGYTQYQLHHWPEASEALGRSLRLSPNSPNAAFAHYYWGLALLKESKPGEAETHLKQAHTLGQNHLPAELHWHLAQLYSHAKRYKEAADELEIYLKRSPGHQDAERIRDLIKQLRGKEKTAAPAPSE